MILRNFKVPETVFVLFSETIVKSLESLRAFFFWGGTDDSKKLAWVKWSNILSSMDKGGLGVGSLKAFNMSLLLKWRWRLFQNPNALWVHVVKAIHGDEAGIDLNGCNNNGVWAGIVGSINHLHSSGIVPLNSIRFKVGDGSSIRFWKDTWLGDAPLYIRYNRLYHLDNNKDCLIQHRIANSSWAWDWSRPVNAGRTKDEFDALIFDIATIEPDDLGVHDSCIWSLSHEDSFSVNAVRKHIDELTLPTLSPSTRWCKAIPRKVNIFMWRLFLNRLPIRLNLSSRGLEVESIACPVCNISVESDVHSFFTCDTASAVWRLVRAWTGSTFPSFSSCGEWDSWFQSWHTSKEKKDRAYAIFAASCWTIWRYRNSITFNSHSMRKCDIFDYICLFSFSWIKFRGNFCITWNDWLQSPL